MFRKKSKKQKEQAKTDSSAPSRKSRGSHGRSSGISSRRTPPVLSRSEIGMNTAVLDHRSLPRRRVDVPLPSTGAEIRLPAVPAVNNKWRFLSGLLSVSLLMCLVLVSKAGYFQVDEIKLLGLERFTDAEISRAINISGSSIFFIHPEKIIEDLQHTYPGLSDIEVDVSWPSTVRISIQERNPVLAWSWEGHVRWVDENGVAFEPHDEGLDVVKVNSLNLPPTIQDRFVDPRIVQTVAALADYLPENTEMIYDTEHGLGWQDPKGWVVYFGFNDGDAAQKIIVYQALVDYLESKRITPAIINVEFLESPYFRMGS
jgi:hypothetical protein